MIPFLGLRYRAVSATFCLLQVTALGCSSASTTEDPVADMGLDTTADMGSVDSATDGSRPDSTAADAAEVGDSAREAATDGGLDTAVGGCGLDGPKCDPGLWCSYPLGTCGKGVRGECLVFARPGTGGTPVCGCDGATYTNAGFAASAGVSILSEGACAPTGGCKITGCNGEVCADADVKTDCTSKPEFACYKKVGICERNERTTVCGWRESAELKTCLSDATGGVGKFCGGFAGTRCSAGLFCKSAAGMCKVADGGGSCALIPTVCTKELKQVCGCDGKTYSNECQADVAMIAVDYIGACK